MAVVVNLGELQDVPSARRVQRADWRDPRLWIGVVLVAVSVVAGARIVGGADDTIGVWAVRADVPDGGVLDPDDLVERQVRFADASDVEAYLRVSDGVPVARHVRRTVGAGELVPAAALGAASAGQSQVSVSLPAHRVPPGVRTGSVVDLWLAPEKSSEESRTRTLAQGVTVLEAPAGESEFAGGASDRQIVLGLADAESVASVVEASTAGQLVLVGRG